MDNLKESSKKLGQVKQNTDQALRKDFPKIPIIHRARDAFDSAMPFDMEFETYPTGSEYLTLIFTPPPPSPCWGQGCLSGTCEFYRGTDTVLTTLNEFISETVVVFKDEIVTSSFTITGVNQITLGFTPLATENIKVCYVYELPNCVPSTCIDTFTRTYSDGWGTSGVTPLAWTLSAGGTVTSVWSVNGTQGEFNNTGLSSIKSFIQLGVDTIFVQPVEILLTVTNDWLRTGGSNGSLQFGGASVTWVKFGGGSPFQGAQIFAQGFTPTVSKTLGNSYYIRVRSTTSRVQVKVWDTTDSEPVSWDFDDTDTDNVLTPVQINGVNGNTVRFYIDDLEIVEGCD